MRIHPALPLLAAALLSASGPRACDAISFRMGNLGGGGGGSGGGGGEGDPDPDGGGDADHRTKGGTEGDSSAKPAAKPTTAPSSPSDGTDPPSPKKSAPASSRKPQQVAKKGKTTKKTKTKKTKKGSAAAKASPKSKTCTHRTIYDARTVSNAVDEILGAVSEARAEAASAGAGGLPHSVPRSVQVNVLLSGAASDAIPPYLRTLDGDRFVEELEHYRDNGGRWSERAVLGMFHWSATGGEGTGGAPTEEAVPPSPERVEHCATCSDGSPGQWGECCGCPGAAAASLTHAAGWLDPNVHVCDWEGITCGITTAGAGLGKFPYAVDKNCRCDVDPDTGEKTKCDLGIYELELTDEERAEEDELYEPDEIMRRRNRRTIYCPPQMEQPPSNAVTKIDLLEYGLVGMLAPELYHLKWLHRLNLNDNRLRGTIPSTYGLFENLHFIDLGENRLTGTIPPELSNLTGTLDELWLEKNRLTGTLPSEIANLTVGYLDVSGNKLTGTLPTELGAMVKLGNAYLEENRFSGTIPTELAWAPLRTLDLGSNRFSGSVPPDFGWMKDLVELNLSRNLLDGTLPDDLFALPRLESMVLSWNRFSGDIPSDMNYEDDPFEDDDQYDPPDYIWTGVPRLVILALDHNNFYGTIPPDMLLGISPTLKILDLSDNELSGTVPSQFQLLRTLERLDLSYNEFEGQLPPEIGDLTAAVKINLTANGLTGTVPDKLCKLVLSMYGCEGVLCPLGIGCDVVLCPPGTFHPDGAANERGACRVCTDPDDDDDEYIPLSTVLGRTHCDTVEFVNGDMDGDGELDEREILHLIYLATRGYHWGDAFLNWLNFDVDKCTLAGVNCKDGAVTKIDLREAVLCADVEDSVAPPPARGIDAAPPVQCPGLPRELGMMANLEVLDLSGSAHLRGTIPTEVGMLKALRVLDLSSCTSLSGTIPSEIGMASSLRVLNLAESSISGTVPDTIGNLRMLEKINLGLNTLRGSLPSTLGGLESIREILVSRAHLTGTLPSALGNLPSLENLELYGNSFVGPIPDMSKAAALKRIDCFNNKLSGPFPTSLANISQLQIAHLKNNQLTGTLPEDLGNLPVLSWLDVSNNQLVGTIPASLGTSTSLRDIRMGGNKIHGPVPESLCTNSRINGGRVRQYGCDAVICPLGTYSAIGYATELDNGECTECPEGETTQYLGSRECRTFTQRDFLSMFFDAMGGEGWSEEQKRGWNEEGVPECEWEGVSCDEDGKVDGLAFPISGSSWDPSVF